MSPLLIRHTSIRSYAATHRILAQGLRNDHQEPLFPYDARNPWRDAAK
jgi:hypothetical protein